MIIFPGVGSNEDQNMYFQVIMKTMWKIWVISQSDIHFRKGIWINNLEY